MRLTSVQVTLLREAVDRYLGNIASRGHDFHFEIERLAEEFLKVIAGGESSWAKALHSIIASEVNTIKPTSPAQK